jgi:hypothetical protein
MHQRDERALKILGIGAIVGALFGGGRGMVAGLVVGGAVAAEGFEQGGGAAFLKCFVVTEKAMPEDETIYDAIPVFNDAAPVAGRLMLTDGRGL